MKIYNKIIVLVALLSAPLAGCQPGAEDCITLECSSAPGLVDDFGPVPSGLQRFSIEIVGEGEVLVNEQACATTDGICHLDVPPGTVITLDGDFRFSSEAAGAAQEGQCARERGCRLYLDKSVHIVADVDILPEEPGGRHIERRPFGLLPGQPGMIVDNFHGISRHTRAPLSQGGANSN